ncbi:MAG: HEAT repeat domain-containing protein [Tepidisphaeraceae bacterium]|jgi:HEAT repeat protein
MVRLKVRIAAICLSAGAVGLWSRAVAQDVPASAPPTTTDSSKGLLQTLSNPQASQDDRDAAALKLVGSHDDTIRPDLVVALTQSDDGGQLAVARALGEIAWPNPDFIEPLFRLLANREGQRSRVRAAAAALAQYSDNSDVLQRLATVAISNQGDEIRVPVIIAIGSFNQKLAAQTLIGLQEQADTDAVEIAAGDALVQMTGLDAYGHNAQQWKKWWDQNANLSESAFEDAIRASRADAFEQEVSKHTQLKANLESLLQGVYEAQASQQDRANLLIQYMHSPAPAIRKVGATIVYQDRQTPDGAPPGTMETVRGLLDDVSPDVRAAAAQALFNDADSAPEMVQRLGVEPDDMVRVELVNSLAHLFDPTAVSLMVKLVQSDPSMLVQIASADGIRLAAEGTTIFNDPAKEQTARAALQAALKSTGQPGTQALRAAIVGALAAMHDPQLLQLFQSLLDPHEPEKVRFYAIHGLGNLDDPDVSDSIAASLDDQEPEIRRAAVEALGTTVQPIYITNLLKSMNEDPDPSVQAAAWQVLQGWLGSLEEPDLATLADALKNGDPNKKLVALEAFRDRLIKDVQSATDDTKRRTLNESLAAQRQNIGDTMMDLGQYAAAADQYQSALGYWKANEGKPDVIDTLSGDVVKSLLKAQKYTDAATFASAAIQEYDADPTLKFIEETVSSEFLLAAQDLYNSNDPSSYDRATELFAAIKRMNPPLKGSYPDELAAVQQQIAQKRSGQGGGAAPGQ